VNTAPRTRSRGLLLPGLSALVCLAVLVALGTWQLQRKAWKEGLIAALNERGTAAPVALPPPDQWQRLNQQREEFRRVSFAAEFLPGEEALVYTSGSALRPDVSGPGYWVLAPAHIPGGAIVVVNRGFVPEGRQNPQSRGASQGSSGMIVGALRWPEAPSLFTPDNDTAHNLWFARDIAAIAAAKHWGPVAPFYVEQETPVPPGGLPKPGPIRPTLPNNHLQYALTWYGLALVLLAGFVFWAWGPRGEAWGGENSGGRA
jgi:surfeit locus 1 family protein